MSGTQSKSGVWPVVIVAAILVVAAGVAIRAFAARPVSIDPACAFVDGENYCDMARGHLVYEPFNRRPVVPEIARALTGSLESRFRAIALVGLAVSAACSASLARRIARRLGCDRATLAATGVAAAAALIVIPHGLRLGLSVPILTDEAALAVGLGWILLFTSRNDFLAAASVPAALLAVATREIWAIIIVAACLIAVFFGRRIVAVANAAVAVVAYDLVHHLHHLTAALFTNYSDRGTFRQFWDLRFSNTTEVSHMIWGVVFAVGLIPFVFIYRQPFSWLRRELTHEHDLTATVLLISGFLMIGSAPFTGADITRLAYPGGVLLLTLALPWLAADRHTAIAGIAAAAVTVFVWSPTAPLISTTSDYIHFYLPWSRTSIGLVLTGTAALAALVASYASRQPPTSANVARTGVKDYLRVYLDH